MAGHRQHKCHLCSELTHILSALLYKAASMTPSLAMDWTYGTLTTVYLWAQMTNFPIKSFLQLTHSCPYESSRSLTLLESHDRRFPNRSWVRNPFSAMMTKYVKNPADAWIIPIWPYAIPINLCTSHFTLFKSFNVNNNLDYRMKTRHQSKG